MTPQARAVALSSLGKPRTHVWWTGGLAAAAALLIVTAALLQAPASAWFADYRTTTGERERIVLADGSIVHLDSATALSVQYGSHRRDLILHHGQALFEVTRDPQRPFVVKAGDSEVRAVGTVFQVEHRQRHVDVVVSEGLVEVKTRDQAEAPLRLHAGQAADKPDRGGFVPQPTDAGVATAWQRGKLIFNRRPLAEVIGELERYSPSLILIMNDQLAQLEVTGVFALDDIDASLQLITRSLPVQLTRLPYLTLLH